MSFFVVKGVFVYFVVIWEVDKYCSVSNVDWVCDNYGGVLCVWLFCVDEIVF